MTFRLSLIAVLLCLSSGAAEKTQGKDIPVALPHVSGVSVTVGDLINIGDSGVLVKLANQDFPAALAFRVKRMIDALMPEVTRAITARGKMFTDENSDPVKGQDAKPTGARIIKPEKAEAFQKTYTAFAAEKVELLISPLTPDDLDGVKLTARDVASLGPLVKEK